MTGLPPSGIGNRGQFESVTTEEVNTVRYASSVAEIQSKVNDASQSSGFGNQGGLKIIVENGTLSPAAADLPVDLGDGGVVIEGQGNKPTEIDISGIGKSLFKMTGGVRGLRIENLMIQGDKTTGAKAIEAESVNNAVLNELYIQKMDDGISLKDVTMFEISNVECDNCATDGLFIDEVGSSGNQRWTIHSSEFNSHGQHGLNATRANAGLIAGTSFSHNSEWGAKLENVGSVTFTGGWFEGNGQNLTRNSATNPADLSLNAHKGSTASSIGVRDTLFSPRSDGTAIVFGDVDGVTVDNCTFSGGGNSEQAYEFSSAMNNVRVTESNRYDSMGGDVMNQLAGESSNISPHRLNAGEWVDTQFGGLGEIDSGAANLSLPAEGFTIVVTNDYSVSSGVGLDINTNYPPEVIVRGRGKGVRIESTSTSASDYALRVRKNNVKIVDLEFAQTDTEKAVRVGGDEVTIRDCVIADAGDDGIWTDGSRGLYAGNICKSSSIGGNDIDDNGSNNRHIGNDASVDTSGATSAVTAGNADAA